MEIASLGYSFLIPLLLPASWLLKNNNKTIAINIIAVANITLILYSVFQIRQLLGLYYLTREFNVGSKSSNAFQMVLDSYSCVYLFSIVIPFLFLIKQFSGNRILAMLMFVLLNWNTLISNIQPMQSFDDWHYYSGIEFINGVLNYFCLLVSSYALLWLLKRLPHSTYS